MKKNQTLTSRIRTFLLVLLACTMTGNVQARKTNDSSPSPVSSGPTSVTASPGLCWKI